MGGERRIAAALSFVVLGIVAAPLAATQVKTFRAQSQQAFLAGTLKGVSLDALGRMELSSRAERVASVGEPFLLAAANHPDGWVVGTGNAGKVLLIDRQGKVSELFAAPEPEVFALWVDPDGTVFAGTSPRGKVYRIPRKGAKAGAAEVFFDPGETYIWSLARAADGALLVATGTQGKLFRVEGKGKGKVLYDSDDTHLRALLALPGGGLLLGTAGEGLILELARDGTVRTLYDAQQPEVVALAAAPDGTRYAAVVASEASLLDLAKPPGAPPVPAAPGARKPRAAAAAEPTVTVTVEGEPPPAPGAAKAVAGPRSEVLRISPSGVVEKLWSFNDETVYSLLWQDGSLWVGTGVEGKLYRYEGSQMLLEKDLDERQIVALLPGKPGPAFATTNASALYRVTAGRERQGTYTSAPIDAGQMARFGSFRWRGEVPPGSAVRFSFRSGVSAEPDHTWSVWTAPREGEELPLAGVPLGRYVQWRAEFSAGSAGGGEAGPRLYASELSYRQENLRPKIDSLTALEPGQILVPANFNPANQVFEPAHPSRDGIFVSLEPAQADEGGRVKPLWKKGYRSLRWTASDPNDDRLTYELSFRPAAAGDHENGPWRKIADDLSEDYYSFDSTVLPDGVYRFRLVASDRRSNDPDTALSAELVSEPVVVDHTPPALGAVEVADGVLRVAVKDELSPLREAVYSLNAGDWKPARSADSLLDGHAETLLIDLPHPGQPGDLLLLRVTDAAYNVVTFDLSHHLSKSGQ